MGNIIGIASTTGYQSGKDTSAYILMWLMAKSNLDLNKVLARPEYYRHELEGQSGWEIKKYATKLKTICSVITGVTPSNWEDSEFKNNLVPGWNLTGREFLQRVGTELFRNGLESDVWVKALFTNFKPYLQGSNLEEVEPKWIITDVRFKNEADAIRERGGVIIDIQRGENHDPHTTENALKGYNFNYIIDNNGSIDHLKTQLNAVLDSVLVE